MFKNMEPETSEFFWVQIEVPRVFTCMTPPHYLTSEPGYLEYKINVCKEFST